MSAVGMVVAVGAGDVSAVGVRVAVGLGVGVSTGCVGVGVADFVGGSVGLGVEVDVLVPRNGAI